MASKVNICSMACTLIGANRVTDLDNPTTEEERLCVLWWDQVLEETLHEHDWKFAREYKAALAVSVSPSGEYDHAYQLPSDCLVLRYLWDTDSDCRVVADEYEIQGTQILTDLDTVNVVYTKRDANVGRYPTFFVRALTYLLAHYLAFKLSEKGAKAPEMRQLYAVAISKAIDNDQKQGNYPQDKEDPWLTAAGLGGPEASGTIVQTNTGYIEIT